MAKRYLRRKNVFSVEDRELLTAIEFELEAITYNDIGFDNELDDVIYNLRDEIIKHYVEYKINS